MPTNDPARRDRGVALEGPRRAPRRVLGYARVSSAEQALGTSLRDQQDSIKAYASSLGLKVTRFFVEAESGIREKVEQREQLRLLLAEAREGDLVLVDKLDRWSRDTEHTLRTVRELAERGASFFAVSDRCDPALREGQLMLTIRAALAKEEHARIRERTVGTRNILTAQGYFASAQPPFGYRRKGAKGTRSLDKNELVIVPDEAEYVRRIFAMYLGGKSMQQIADGLEREVSSIKRILDCRTYAGQIRTPSGEWIVGKWEPIIAPATFARVRTLAETKRLGGARPRTQPSRTHDWPLRDVARCMHCGARMSASWAKRRTGELAFYYRCAHRCEAVAPKVTNGSYVPIDEAHGPFEVMVLARLAELRADLGRDERAKPRAVLDFAAKREKVAEKRLRAQNAYVDGNMSRAELGAVIKRLDDDLLRLDAEEAAASPPERSRAWRRAALAEVGVIELAWERAEGRIRRDIVNRLAIEVRIARDELPAPRWRPLAELLGEVVV